ncbi:MAG: sugar ABC transporter permease [Anaerolineales bacterium]
MTSMSLSQKPHPNQGMRRREGLVGLLFISPWVLGFILFSLLPALTALAFSFTDYHLLSPDKIGFAGPANYIKFLADRDGWSCLMESMTTFVVVVPLELLIALTLAAVVSSERLRLKGLLRAVFFLPCIISFNAAYVIAQGFLDPQRGWISQLVTKPLGLPPVDTPTATIVITAMWLIGPSFLILYGAMQGISKEVRDAARVDGAGPLTSFLSITLPIISPAIFFSLVVNLAVAFGGSIFFQLPTPMDSYIRYVMFSDQNVGYAAALIWIMFAVTMTITIFLFRSARRWVYFPEEAGHETLL